jgi:L-aspartate oxidase
MTLPGSPAPKPDEKSAAATPGKPQKASSGALALKTIRDVMWNKVGILRSGKELTEGLRQLAAVELPKTARPGRAEHELRNLHLLATLITRSGLAREESRGSHYRSDFPYRDDEKFSKHSTITKGEEIRFEG